MTNHKVGARFEAKNLVAQVRMAVKASDWLTPTDQPLVELAVYYAQQIEQSQELLVQVKAGMSLLLEDPDSTPDQRLEAARLLKAASEQAEKSVGWLGPHFINAIKALGQAPVERKMLTGEVKIDGKLNRLRTSRLRDASRLDSSAS